MKKTIMMIFVALFAINLQAEDFKGKLMLKGTTVGVEGVDLKVKGGVKYSTSTNYLGEFTIKNVKYPFKIVFSKDDYIKSSFTVKNSDNLIFEISKKEKSKIEKRKEESGLSTEIKYRKEDSSAKTLLQRLSTVPGVIVRGNSVTIRGGSSVNSSNEPLVVVDGINQSGSISDIQISPDIIHSITVVKGAATSSYGLRGANGVIVIKTKSRMD